MHDETILTLDAPKELNVFTGSDFC